MVSNSAKLDRRAKQHTQFGVSASNNSRDMAWTKSWLEKKNNEGNWMVSNSAKLDRRNKQHTQFGVSARSGSRDMAWTKSWQKKGKKKKITRQVLGRPVCDRGAIPRTLVQSNVVRSRLMILINEEINKANCMVSNSAKLDRRIKQHTQFGVSASNGSRDMAATKSWRKKKKKITKRIA